MLARYLRTHTAPIRYAGETRWIEDQQHNPLVALALSNYLRGHMIAHGLHVPAYGMLAGSEGHDLFQQLAGNNPRAFPGMAAHLQPQVAGTSHADALAHLLGQYQKRMYLPGEHHAHQAYLPGGEAAQQGAQAAQSEMGGSLPASVRNILRSLMPRLSGGMRAAVQQQQPLAAQGHLDPMLTLHHLAQRNMPGTASLGALSHAIRHNVAMRHLHEKMGDLGEQSSRMTQDYNEFLPGYMEGMGRM